jgi:hypothetical protein
MAVGRTAGNPRKGSMPFLRTKLNRHTVGHSTESLSGGAHRLADGADVAASEDVEVTVSA